jgi:hypothetical protein
MSQIDNSKDQRFEGIAASSGTVGQLGHSTGSRSPS